MTKKLMLIQNSLPVEAMRRNEKKIKNCMTLALEVWSIDIQHDTYCKLKSKKKAKLR